MAAGIGEIFVKWSGKEYKISDLCEAGTVLDLKRAIQKETGVLPERQKLLGLKYKGKAVEDDVALGDLQLKPGCRVMMMGSTEAVLADVIAPPADLPEVINDFDIEEEEIAIHNREEYLAKVEKRIRDYEVKILSEPRLGKKLLVLDIDYTLFDHRSVGETGADLMRPFLHEFLTSAYEHYEIVIWSATSMKWIEAKMSELGVTSNTQYRLCFMLDSLAMITVDTPDYGVIEVKPLGVIWGKFPQWNNTNTIMFDDLRRNFIMNPQNGLKVKPFKSAHLNRSTDRELLHLSQYLRDIAMLDDLTSLNHRHWQRYKPKKTSSQHGKRLKRESPTDDSSRT